MTELLAHSVEVKQTHGNFPKLSSLTHLLLSPVQRLLHPLGEESGSGLDVRAHLALGHRRFSSLGCLHSIKRSPPPRPLLPEKLPPLLNFTSSQGGGGGATIVSRHRDGLTHTYTHTHARTGGVKPSVESSPFTSSSSSSAAGCLLLLRLVGGMTKVFVSVLICSATPHCCKTAPRSHLLYPTTLTWKVCV